MISENSEERIQELCQVFGDMLEENGIAELLYDIPTIIMFCDSLALPWEKLIEGTKLNEQLGYSQENASAAVLGRVPLYYSHWMWSPTQQKLKFFSANNFRRKNNHCTSGMIYSCK